MDKSIIDKDMTIDEWLHRLSLLHLKSGFDKQKIRRASELRYIENEGQFFEY